MSCPRKSTPCPPGMCQGRPGCTRFETAFENVRRAVSSCDTNTHDATKSYPWALPELRGHYPVSGVTTAQEENCWRMFGLIVEPSIAGNLRVRDPASGTDFLVVRVNWLR